MSMVDVAKVKRTQIIGTKEMMAFDEIYTASRRRDFECCSRQTRKLGGLDARGGRGGMTAEPQGPSASPRISNSEKNSRLKHSSFTIPTPTANHGPSLWISRPEVHLMTITLAVYICEHVYTQKTACAAVAASRAIPAHESYQLTCA
jgi:hypothetical protein